MFYGKLQTLVTHIFINLIFFQTYIIAHDSLRNTGTEIAI